MSVTLLVGLLMQAAAAVIVLVATRGRWLARIGALFVLIAVSFHGLTEIFQFLVPGRNFYRDLVDQEEVDEWVLIAGLAILLFSVGYAWVIALSAQRFRSGAVELMTPPVNWKVALAATAPLYLLALSLGPASGAENTTGYLLTSLVGQFLVFGVILTSFSHIVDTGGRHVTRVLILQSFALALLAQRLNVVVGVLVLLSLLARYRSGHRSAIRPRHVVIAFTITGVLVVGISAARVVTGREGFADTPLRRISTLLSGLDVLNREDNGERGITDDFVYRFDGNTFPALVKEKLDIGVESTGGASLFNSMRLAVPRFLYPGKLETELEKRNEEYYILAHYGINTQIDFVPTLIGTVYSYQGTLLLLAVALGFGVAVAALDLYLDRKRTIGSLVAALGVSYAILYYEQTTDIYFITLRTMLVFLIAFKIVSFIRRSFATRPVGQPEPEV